MQHWIQGHSDYNLGPFNVGKYISGGGNFSKTHFVLMGWLVEEIVRTNLEGAVPTITLQKLVSKHATLEEPGQNARPQNTTIFQFSIDRAWPSAFSYFYEISALKIKMRSSPPTPSTPQSSQPPLHPLAPSPLIPT